MARVSAVNTLDPALRSQNLATVSSALNTAHAVLKRSSCDEPSVKTEVAEAGKVSVGSLNFSFTRARLHKASFFESENYNASHRDITEC